MLENGEYQRVGETQTRVSRARIVAATNRDLREEVRLRPLPRRPLPSPVGVRAHGAAAARAGRGQAAPARALPRAFAAKSGSQPFQLDEAARARWLAYAFPGNVRELRNIVIRLTTKYAGLHRGEADLEAEFAPAAGAGGADPVARRPATSCSRDVLQPGRRRSRRVDQAYLDAAIEIAKAT